MDDVNDRNRRPTDPDVIMAPRVAQQQRRAVSRPIPIPYRNKEQQFSSHQRNDTEKCLAHSLPAHLRAPMLSSTPRGLPDDVLPLLGDSATVTAASTPYGSLRESQHFVSAAAASAPTRSGIMVAPNRGGRGKSGLAALLSSREQQHDVQHDNNNPSNYYVEPMSNEDEEDESVVVASSLTTGLDILRRSGGHPVVPRSYSEPAAAFLLPPAAAPDQFALGRASLPFQNHHDTESPDEPFELDL